MWYGTNDSNIKNKVDHETIAYQNFQGFNATVMQQFALKNCSFHGFMLDIE